MTLLRLILFFLALFAPYGGVLQAEEAPPFPIHLELGQKEGGEAILGLKLDIQKPWRVYAPSPQGEVGFGFPPELNWATSQNIASLMPEWPASTRETMETGEVAFIYSKPTAIPLTAALKDAQKSGVLNLKVSLLACADLCIPINVTLTCALPQGDLKGDANVLEAHDTVELEYEGLPLGMLLLGALLGGFILNFMPCVLPILSIKLLGLVKHAKHEDIVRAKKGFLLSTLGILCSFLLLGIIAIILKASGEAVGWGIHFQNPYFLSFMFAILFLFAASFWGIFEFQLPNTVSHWILSEKSKGYTKDFLIGMFATLLATPCSAPFVGSAVGFALAHDTSDILSIFLALGIGFSAPYWIGGILPERFFWLPKPGAWMLILERVLAFGLTLSVLWIGVLLSSHVSYWSVILMVIALVILSFIIRRHEQGKLWSFKTVLVTGSLFLIGIITLPVTFLGLEAHLKQDSQAPSNAIWQPFNPHIIPELITQGKIIFVDITADWCVTCKVNKQFVLNTPPMMAFLSSPNVVAMQGDWTRQDAEITTFLQNYERYGIPFNIIFGPLNPKGNTLPELLSQSGVAAAFQDAGFQNTQKGLK